MYVDSLSNRLRVLTSALVLLLMVVPCVQALEQASTECRHHDPLRQAFFGDLHVHTRYSLDASTQDTRTTPDQAYQFAKGAKLPVQPWLSNGEAMRFLQLERPLDFAMVSDHAELFGEVNLCSDPNSQGFGSWQCMIYRHMPRAAYYLFNFKASMQAERLGFCGDDGALCRQAALKPWQEMRDAAARHNQDGPDCEFTAFIGYEWTGSVAPLASNLHRNVVFRNATVPVLPFSFVDGQDPQMLWRWLESECNAASGDCESLTIPHNSNVSTGFMFQTTRSDGLPITAGDAALRQKYEPLVEIMQHKGSSECFNGAVSGSPIARDELCAFEQLSVNGLSDWGTSAPESTDGFLREVLRDGLLQEQKLGENPFKWGFIGSSDTHLGAPGAVNENRFLGHGGAGLLVGDEIPKGLPDDIEYNPGGLAVLWAEENTRDSLFDAMLRRESYGTSGPRIVTRFFGGWDFPETMCSDPDFVDRGYEQGVPMGSDLAAMPAKSVGQRAAPVFAVYAKQDPGTPDLPGTALQRIQIIKGWVDDRGQRHEKVYEVAGDAQNGADVNHQTCALRGAGFSSLCSVWRDPDFSADMPAYYYSRVVENPSCRWSQKICASQGVDCGNPDTVGEGLAGCCDTRHRPVIQERAWTSPIWYQRP